nr:hypothetical protein Iba_chr02fCG2490 [Ipomoea batatas]
MDNNGLMYNISWKIKYWVLLEDQAKLTGMSSLRFLRNLYFVDLGFLSSCFDMHVFDLFICLFVPYVAENS